MSETLSHLGSPIKPNGEINHEAYNRSHLTHQLMKNGDKDGSGLNVYMPFDGRRPTAKERANPDHPNSKNLAKLYALKKVRVYDKEASTPEPSEKEEYHHPDGHGRIKHGDKSYAYQDHSVVQHAKLVGGGEIHPSEHDVRTKDVDVPTVKHKDKQGNVVGGVIPSLMTHSTPDDHSGFFHHLSKIDHEGTYHLGHPRDIEAAKANTKSTYQKIKFFDKKEK